MEASRVSKIQNGYYESKQTYGSVDYESKSKQVTNKKQNRGAQRKEARSRIK
jgi:hypothetical protein